MKLKTNTIKGFTLLELIAVVTIIGVVVAIANPSYDSYTRRSEVAKAARGFESALQTAKQNSRISGRRMTVCGTADIDATPITCLDKSGLNAFNQAGTTTTMGWIVFYDKNKDDKVDSGEKIHKIVPIDQRRVRLVWNGNYAIDLSPRNETGSSGTMRIYSPRGANAIAHCSGLTNLKTCPLVSDMHESRVTVSTLGNITYRK